MIKTTMKVAGMACSNCEAHVNDAIRNTFPVKKVTSSHVKGKTEILTEMPVDARLLKAAVEACGYTVSEVKSEPYEKKGLFSFKK